MNIQGSRVGTVYGILTAMFFGVGAVLAKFTVAYLAPLPVAFLDLSLGFVLLLPFLWVKRVPIMKGLRKEFVADLLLASIIGLALPLLAILYGLRMTSAIKGGALVQLQTWAAVLFGVVLLKERLSLIGLVGGVFAAAGGLAVSLQSLQPQIFRHVTIGDGLVFLGALGLGYGFIPTKKLSERLDSLQIAALRLLLGAILLGPLLLAVEIEPVERLPLEVVLVLLVYVFTNFSLGYLTLHEGLRLLSTWRIASLMQTIPVFSTLAAVLLLGERLTWFQVIGTLLIIVGNLMIERSKVLA